MINMFDPNNIEEALTFDDVLLLPQKSDVLPHETDVSTYLTPKIKLNIPLISAAMDTVTEHRLAIALAREGGIGIIHRNMSIEDQKKEVERVKKAESGMITEPITIGPNQTVKEALEIMATYKISGVPVVDEDNKLIGILTNRDLRFLHKKDYKKPVEQFMTKTPLVTAKEGTTLDEAMEILQKHKVEKLPVVDEEGRLKGLITIKDIVKRKQYPNACKDELGRLRVGAAVGTGPDTFERVAALIEAGVDVIIVDTAHGHSVRVLKTIEKIREMYPDLNLIGGNIATAEAAEDLIKAGVDGVKIGVGPGSICTTRVVAGIGVPQVTAVAKASEVAHKYGKTAIADGGIS